MKFVRIGGLTDSQTYEVNYCDFINMIYYNEKLDNFLLCVNEIKNLCENVGKVIKRAINILNCNDGTDYVIVDKLLSYLKNKLTEEFIPNKTKTQVCKFDLDSDGKITFEDLRGILQRYANTAFFKYENSEKG